MRVVAEIKIIPGKPDAATEYEQNDRLEVAAHWEDCEADHNYAIGWGFGKPTKRTRALAERLVKAVNAQVVFGEPTIAKNVHGFTYVSTLPNCGGRWMNADLKKLGF